MCLGFFELYFLYTGEVLSDDEEDIKQKKKDKRKQAAAALCVEVGSFSDPDDLPGLAHFLEHMVFMGSSLYPNENYFDAFIKQHGGDDNAFTECERTIFKFEVNPSHLKEALQIWAQFFICPLLKKSSIHREVKAVDSEFRMALVDDRIRGEQLLGKFCKKNHPIGKFLWGNEQTLKKLPSKRGINIHDALHHFHKQYYNANSMSLAVQSIEDLDTLQEWVMEIFRQVPNNFEAQKVKFLPNVPFPIEKFDHFQVCQIIPINQIQELCLMWFVPPQQEHYRTKPLHYISWLIGHEGRGSLLSLLKEEHLALSLCAEVETSGLCDCSLYSMICIVVTLTEKGCTHFEQVMDYVFQYLYMMRKNGPLKRIYDEIQQIEEINFSYKEEEDPMEYVEDLCENMQQFSPEEVLTG